MRRIFVFLMLCFCLASYAQQLTVKSVSPRPQDARARTKQRDDAKGNKCAIVRVGVVGVDNLVFPDAVGDVERVMSEYVVYVPNGLKKLKYKDNAGNDLGSVSFDDYGIEVNSLESYDVILESGNHLRTAIFTSLPPDAQLKFDGQLIKVSKDGTAMVNKPVGEYSYQVEADGYNRANGTVCLTEDEISTTTVVALQVRKHKVNIEASPEEATVFVDNVPYDDVVNLELTEGKHTIRVTAPLYDDKEMTIVVKDDMTERISLKKADQEVVKHKEERSRTSINVRNAVYSAFSVSMMGVPEIGKIIDKENAFDFAFESSWVCHFAGIMGLRMGAGIGLIKSNKNEKYVELAYNSEIDSLEWLLHVDIPLQIGFSLPFGKYNQHMFNLFGGGYGSFITRIGIKDEVIEPDDEVLKNITKEKDEIEDHKVDYGIRVSAKIDIGHFVLGADLSQSLNAMGFSAGVNLGWKIYTKKKNK